MIETEDTAEEVVRVKSAEYAVSPAGAVKETVAAGTASVPGTIVHCPAL
jgi:hypothetical protein